MREASLRLADQGLVAMLAATLGLFAILGAWMLASARDSSRDPMLEPLDAFKQMRHVAGSGAIACGQVAHGVDPGPALACAKRAALQGNAFWVAREHWGEGIWWHGLVRTTRGQYYRVVYDHGSWTRPNSEPRHPALWTVPCRDAHLDAKGWDCED